MGTSQKQKLSILSKTLPISPYQFAVFRLGFGCYLIVHFLGLLPYGPELFSNVGILHDPGLNPLHGIFPNPLAWFGTPEFVTITLLLAVALSVAFTFGLYRRSTAFMLWFIWACLYNRNNLISNPGLPYVGLLFILCALLPPGDKLSARKRLKRSQIQENNWNFPIGIYWTAWWLLAIGYTFSGIVKLNSPSWVNGQAIMLLLENPLARPGIVRDIFIAAPESLLKAMTWSALALEIMFLFMSFHRITRFIAWTGMIGMHIGIVLVVDFADLTIGMLMIHWFTLDPDWFRPTQRLISRKNIVFFDGHCLLCNAIVRFLLAEDRSRMLYYAPLQGESFAIIAQRHNLDHEIKSIVFVEDLDGSMERIHTHSNAVGHIMTCVGGFWTILGSFLLAVPQILRDCVYRVIATRRYNWFGKTESRCDLLSKEERARFLP